MRFGKGKEFFLKRKEKFSIEAKKTEPSLEAAVQPPKAPHGREALLQIVTDEGYVELKAREANVSPGQVVHSQEVAVLPGYTVAGQIPAKSPRGDPVQNTTTADRKAIQAADQRLRSASTTGIRALRWLIRAKYRLDIYVWGKRGVQLAIRPDIQKKAQKSDRLMVEILKIVNSWDKDMFEAEEWRLAKKIKDKLIQAESQTIPWELSPPWDPVRLEKSGDDDYDEM